MTDATPDGAGKTGASTGRLRSGEQSESSSGDGSGGFENADESGFVTPETQPTTTSIALALAVTLGTVLTFVAYVDGTGLPVALGAVAAGSYAVSLWLTSTAGRESVTTTLNSVLSLLVGGGLLAATVAATVLAVSSIFPVGERALLSLGTLVVFGRVGVVLGCVLALLGTALGVRNLASREAVVQHARTAGLTVFPASLTAVVLVVSAIAAQAGARRPATVVLEGLRRIAEVFLAPAGGGLYLGSWFVLVALASVAVRLAIGQLPVTELLDDTAGQTKAVANVRRILAGVAVLSIALFAAAGVAELLWSPEDLRTVVGPTAFDTVQTVTSLPAVRYALAVVTATSLSLVVLAWLVRQTARTPGAAITQKVSPIASGTLLTVGAVVFADRIYTWLVATVAGQLPPQMSDIVTSLAESVGSFFGETALVVLLLTILGTGTVFAATGFRIALFFRYLSRETAGFSLASAGLFVATVFAAAVEAPTWLVLGGIVASLFVWDAGRFGTTLGKEIGRSSGTHRAELVHAGGTALVGLVGAGLAIGTTTAATYTAGAESSTATVALVFVTSGIVFLVAALR